MKIAVILNGISLRKNFFYQDILPKLQASFHTEVFETLSRKDAIMLASKAVDRNADLILAAGGDGTLFQVLNGILMESERYRDLPTMGIIPIGSGNDFARTLDITSDPDLLIQAVKNFSTHKLDVGKVHFINGDGQSDERYFINVVDIGMGPEVVRKVLSSGRPFGSAIAYYKNIITTFFTYKLLTIKATTPAWTWENKMRTFAIANGKFYGHGLCIAPDAKPDDGVFNIFACADASVMDFIFQSIPLKKGLVVKHPKVSYYQAKEVELTSEHPCAIEADGELLGWLPARVEFAPLTMKFLMNR